MRHEKAEILLRLALDMQGSAEGLTLEDIRSRYSDKPISRRTAERLRDAVERLVPQMERANPGEVPKRWRIRGGALNGLIQTSAEELAALQLAVEGLGKLNMSGAAKSLKDLHRKLTAALKPGTQYRIATDTEFLATAEGLATRQGPHVVVPDAIMKPLRQAMLADHRIKLHYRARTTGKLSGQLVAPYGFLYGQRPYLVAYSFGTNGYRLWSLANIEQVEDAGTPFMRDPDFNLSSYAANSFGVFQEEPEDIVLRFKLQAAAEARHFLFHPTPTIEEKKNGSLIVRFRAGGLLEMCWHLFTWGDGVTIMEPKELRDLMDEELQHAMKPLQPAKKKGKIRRNV